MAKKDLLSHIALVSQYPVLFRGSVADNIRIGRPDASDAEVEEAGRMSAVDSFINETGEGYSRMIGEMGKGFPAASGSAFPWRGPSETRLSWCWMKPRLPWT